MLHTPSQYVAEMHYKLVLPTATKTEEEEEQMKSKKLSFFFFLQKQITPHFMF